ncbi:MAG: orotidine-5'-phosphate decarboxylase [Gammaproteobacteria bacterium]|nr:MAG: orotidine-5'-phosphate decarboxylase [Gammaproteobacteria bacterium]PIE37102.1 MAG: orotidine-5'-phosphate decarboxylase [Gammaproteobacteria bacterium]
MPALPVIVALDFDNEEAVYALTDRLSPELCRLKVGKELFTRFGPALVQRLQERGFEVFLDLKFHDIPSTVAKAVSAAADLGVWMVNVHASGGSRMMRAAQQALAGREHKPLLIAVTVLTSMNEQDLTELGHGEAPAERAKQLALLAHECGLDGVVCSAAEAPELRVATDAGFALVTPGIRLAGDSANDQRRVMTPKDAVRAGADYLVIGRSITGASDPLAALERIGRELAE